MYKAVETGDTVKVWKIQRVTLDGLSEMFGTFDSREEAEEAIKRADAAFSRSWSYTFPGFIQRGYKKAGLAPDVKE